MNGVNYGWDMSNMAVPLGMWMDDNALNSTISGMMLEKSMDAGTQTGNTGTGGAALQFESVGPIAHMGLFDAEDLTFLQWHKAQAAGPMARTQTIKSVLHQQVVYDEVGDPLLDGNVGETGVAANEDAVVQRVLRQLRVIQVMASYSRLMLGFGTDIVQLPPMMGSDGQLTVRGQIAYTAMLNFMRKVAWKLWYGDSAVNPNEWDGYIKQITSHSRSQTGVQVIDMRGGSLGKEEITSAAATLRQKAYGKVDTIWGPQTFIEGLARQINPILRAQSGDEILIGARAKGITWNGPTIVPYVDIFMDGNHRAHSSAAAGTIQPSAPTIASTSTSTSGGLFTATDAGAYIYLIKAHYAGYLGAGYSASTTSSAITALAGKYVDLVLDDAAVSNVTFYEVWRSDKGGAASTAKWLGRFAKASSGATTIRDGNEKIPGTFDVVALGSHPKQACLVQNGELASLEQPRRGLIIPELFWQAMTPFSAVAYHNIVFRNCRPPAVETLN